MDPITYYMKLLQQRPELFAQSPYIPLCLDEQTMRAFSVTSGKPVGVVYDNSPYYLVLADLCVGKDNRLYTYARVVYPYQDSNGVVVIPKLGDYFGLLTIFRHPPRAESGGEFPRGFANNMTPAENAAKELWEEIGAHVNPVSLVCLGEIQADTGLSSGRVQVFLAQIESTAISLAKHEGIHGFYWVTEQELRERISTGIITDGFTLAAFACYLCMSKGH